MTSTVFTPGTTVTSPWLNDVNTTTYTTVPAQATSITALQSAVTALQSTPVVSGLQNRIINGDMRVSQQGVGPNTPTVSPTISVDRWLLYTTGSYGYWAQVYGPTGFAQAANYLQLAGVAGNAGMFIRQRIESANMQDLAGQSITISFWVNQTTGTTMSVTASLAYPVSLNNFSVVNTIGSSTGTPVPSGTWTKCTWTVSVPAAATTGLQLTLLQNNPTVLAGQVVQISQVQLELGNTATAFEPRPYGLELALCQRYYWQLNNLYIYRYFPAAAWYAMPTIPIPVTMRTAPTVTAVGTYTGTAASSNSVIADTPSTIRWTVNASAAGEGGITAATITASAEL